MTPEELEAEYYNHDYVISQRVAQGKMVEIGNLWYAKDTQQIKLEVKQ